MARRTQLRRGHSSVKGTRLFFGSGSIAIEMDPTLGRITARVLERLAPGLTRFMRKQAREQFRQTKDRWPIGKEGRAGKEGRKFRDRIAAGHPAHSIEAIETQLVIDSQKDIIRVRLFNDAPWARFIKSNQHGLYGRSVFVELMRKPMRERSEALLLWMRENVPDILAGD